MSADFFERFESETVYTPEIAEEYHRRGFWGELSCGEYLDLHADERGSDVAVIDDTTSLTWEELRAQADAIAAGLRERGVEKGTPVAFQLPHCVEWFVLRLGIARVGGISVPVFPRFGEREIGHLIETVRPRVFIGYGEAPDGADIDVVLSRAADVDELGSVFALNEPPEGAEPLETLSVDPAGFSPTHIDPDYPDVLALSSGTTGVPKIYYLVQNSYLSCGKDLMGRYSISEYDTVFSLTPVQQALGHVVSVYLPLVSGATVAVTASNEPADQWARFDEIRPSVVTAIPTQTTKMMAAPEAESYSLEYVRSFLHGGALLPTDVAQRAEEKGALVVNGYGAGEAGVATYTRPMDPPDVRYGTVGLRQMSMQVLVVDEDGETLPEGEVGEVILRGAGCGFGYFDDRPRTEEVFDVGGPREGWFHTNDAGSLDDDGNLEIVGRMDEMINRGGQNVFPNEIEDELMEIDGVAEAAVIGVPDPELGERVGAYVVEEVGSTVTLEDVIDWFESAGLATFKWPERLETIDSLPKSPGGKVRKDDLREDIERKVDAEDRDN